MNKKWGLWTLTTFVVGNMVGGGVFMLPANLANKAGALGSTLAWVLTGFGVLMIALVFGNLAIRKPELKAGRKATHSRFLNRSRPAGSPATAWHGATGQPTGRQRLPSLFRLRVI